MILTRWRLAIAALAAAAVPSIAGAADLPPQSAPPPTAPAAYTPAAPDWIVTVGIEGRAVPAWPGASDTKFNLTGLPLFSIRPAGTPAPYFGPRDSFGFPIINLAQFRVGPALKIVRQRDGFGLRGTERLG